LFTLSKFPLNSRSALSKFYCTNHDNDNDEDDEEVNKIAIEQESFLLTDYQEVHFLSS
jgi:hypothetical protein